MTESKAQKVNKKTFEVEVGGKVIKLVVKRPDQRQTQAGQMAYNRAFREAAKPSDGKSGAIVRPALDGILRDQKLWDDAREAKAKELGRALQDGHRKLIRGNIPLSEGREIAIQMRRDRNELQELYGDRNALDAMTAEAQAENARFNYFVTVCTLYADTGYPYFKNEEDYNARADDLAAVAAATNLASLVYDFDDGWVNNLPENKWLAQWGFADDKGRLIDRKHKWLVDAKGRRIDENGYLLNAEGRRVDEDGQLLTDDGTPLEESLPFLDEDGLPIVLEAVLPGVTPATEDVPRPQKPEGEPQS